MTMLTCRDLTELVTLYNEEELPLMQRLGFRLHVGVCHQCRAFLQQDRLTRRTLAKLPRDPVPPDVREELLRQFTTWRSLPG